MTTGFAPARGDEFHGALQWWGHKEIYLQTHHHPSTARPLLLSYSPRQQWVPGNSSDCERAILRFREWRRDRTILNQLPSCPMDIESQRLLWKLSIYWPCMETRKLGVSRQQRLVVNEPRKDSWRRRFLLKTEFAIIPTISIVGCKLWARNNSKCPMYIKSVTLFHSSLIITLKSQTIIIPGLQMINRNTESTLTW